MGDDVSANREKILNLPGSVTGLIALLAAIQCVTEYGPQQLAIALYDSLAFIPARLSFLIAPQSVIDALAAREALSPGAMEQAALVFAAGPGALLTLLSYAFLHGNWTHFLINALTLAAFGAPVARRFGTRVFLGFLAACAIAGALMHFALHPFDLTPMVGASAAISGTMAAIVRFAFRPGARLGEYAGAVEDGKVAHAPPLSELGENRQAMMFLIAWFAVNLLMGAFPQAAGASEAIAWEAHIGGFLFGLLSFDAFDRAARSAS
ncbi:rhomboid family intramembrane serine protease [Methylocystis sp. WRRC1]|uniref:rhomboid family intramembrane serine protease n=1 Tax=Methylocystis sp. WRRC1 TaxID=1732014 RepID=UPI001D134C23|nr:rhomboid family intramembrane serine protease [Methylocystis sp. WRRC1]MCC3244225.1 rhomboid family intramembrane serine protease [Methylocystis sp. WRRC1]